MIISSLFFHTKSNGNLYGALQMARDVRNFSMFNMKLHKKVSNDASKTFQDFA